jgi:hypothetical protein
MINLHLFAVPRVEVGDPVAGEFAGRAVQALARRLQVGQQVFPDHAVRRAGEFLDHQSLIPGQVDAEPVQDLDGVEVEDQLQAAAGPRHRRFRQAVQQQICRSVAQRAHTGHAEVD